MSKEYLTGRESAFDNVYYVVRAMFEEGLTKEDVMAFLLHQLLEARKHIQDGH